MKTKQTYLIRLQTVAHFFFGGENTFGYGTERNYLVRSRTYPQQTSLLGLLRFVLLQQEGLLAARSNNQPLPEAAVELIGPASFTPDNTGGYGAIRRLSPVFLLDDSGRQWLPAALNKGLRLREHTGARAWLNHDAGSAWILETPEGKAWSSKHELEEALATSDGAIRYPCRGEAAEKPAAWDTASFFHPHEQVGIEKNFTGTTENEAFYKQSSWRLRPDTCFALYV